MYDPLQVKANAHHVRMAGIVFLSALLLATLMGRQRMLPLALAALIAMLATWPRRAEVGLVRMAFQISVVVLLASLLNGAVLVVEFLNRARPVDYTQRSRGTGSLRDCSTWKTSVPDYEAIAKDRLSVPPNPYADTLEAMRRRCLDANSIAEYERKLKEAEERLRARSR